MGTQILGALRTSCDALFIAKMGMGVEVRLGYRTRTGASAACGLWFFYSGSSPLRIRLRFLVRLKMKVIRKICAVGSSPFVTELSFVFYMTLMNNMVKKYGGDIGLSAMGVFLSLDSILFLPALAIGEAVQPVIGYNTVRKAYSHQRHKICNLLGLFSVSSELRRCRDLCPGDDLALQ